MIELRNIVKRFNNGTASETIAIDHVNLTLQEGDFITVIGGNGAGKSTLMNIISGTISPDEGMVLLDNEDVSRLPEYKRAPYFGRVFQDPMVGTAADMTVIENLALAYGRGRRRSLFRWSYRKEDVEFFKEELKSLDLGLEDRMYQKVGLLSGGQRQALTLLMATMRQMPSERIIKRDYVRFCEGDKSKAKEEVLKGFSDAKEERKQALAALKNESLSKEDRKARKIEIKNEYTRKISKFDLTKQILLLDEHTAALDPKTARKVLELTDKAVRDNQMTTLMVTHNMKDALTYGDRLIMFHLGHIILDVSGEEKKKLSVEDLLKMFEDADKKAEQ